MQTIQITEKTLNNHHNDFDQERLKFLIAQANEQIDEISQNKELYEDFCDQADVDEEIDKLVLWILFMSSDHICYDYNKNFDKGFEDKVPMNDLADLLIYIIYLKKIKDTELEGISYILESEYEGIEEVDQHAFTNVLYYVQKSKEAQMEF